MAKWLQTSKSNYATGLQACISKPPQYEEKVHPGIN